MNTSKPMLLDTISKLNTLAIVAFPVVEFLCTLFKVNEYTFSGEATLPFSFLPPFSIGVNSYRKEFAPLGANSFL